MLAGEIRGEGRVPDGLALPGSSSTESPVFFGHYWLDAKDGKAPLASNVACLDYSTALLACWMGFSCPRQRSR